MKALRLLPALALAAGTMAFVSPAGASTHGASDHGDHHGWHGLSWHHEHGHHGAVCTGTLSAPGVLTGTYAGNVVVNGVCLVNQGAASISGNLTITQGSAVVSAFGLDDATGTGNSSLSVGKNVFVADGATLIMGCEPNFFSCLDDPAASTGGTLTSTGSIGGSLFGDEALAVVVHASTIGRDAVSWGGGYGNNCATPTSSPSNSVSLQLWATVANSAPYTDFEDTSIHGSETVASLTSCWLGTARVKIGRDLLMLKNTLNDPDAIEILSNTVDHNLVCFGNTSVWDSAEASFGQTTVYPRTAEPNTVGHHRLGQCVLASPATQGGTPGPGPF